MRFSALMVAVLCAADYHLIFHTQLSKTLLEILSSDQASMNSGHFLLLQIFCKLYYRFHPLKVNTPTSFACPSKLDLKNVSFHTRHSLESDVLDGFQELTASSIC